ncbi:MAG: anthranilate synthase component I family protein [Lachnospiraceae bacterium]|nr:anthranilate synthase component I family protein [Lachnospiraceae bacterium]
MYPSKQELLAYKDQGFSLAPVAGEMLSDMITPIALLKRLREISRHAFILESVENQELYGRYTFLGYDPFLCVTVKNHRLTVKNAEGKVLESYEIRADKKAESLKETVSKQESDTNDVQYINHPDEIIRRILHERRAPQVPGMPGFTGGLVGYFAYDYIKYNEPKLKLDAKDDDGFQDMDLMLFDKVFAFDNLRQKLLLIANVDLSHLDESYEQASVLIEKMEQIAWEGCGAAGPSDAGNKGLASDMRPLFEETAFCGMVEKAKKHIYEGDIFQVVLSNRLEADYEGDLFPVYRTLRTINPSPYMFYFSGDEIEAAGASPETLVKLENCILHTFPLAGTRPRGKTQEEDLALEKELLNDEKELAEHNMLVDLGRNDLGRVSEFGSVEVEKYMSIERFSHVMHIGSTVRGKLREDLEAIDALNAVLPAGTLSGAPKIRACEIINELEDNKRGIYGGAVGYLDFAGNLDTCIAIRLIFRKNGKVYVRSGAGIVADSEPAKEYQETINKAKAVMSAVKKSTGNAD